MIIAIAFVLIVAGTLSICMAFHNADERRNH